jgi:hypothetical protein
LTRSVVTAVGGSCCRRSSSAKPMTNRPPLYTMGRNENRERLRRGGFGTARKYRWSTPGPSFRRRSRPQRSTEGPTCVVATRSVGAGRWRRRLAPPVRHRSPPPKRGQSRREIAGTQVARHGAQAHQVCLTSIFL